MSRWGLFQRQKAGKIAWVLLLGGNSATVTYLLQIWIYEYNKYCNEYGTD
jgi:hypothetical protein